MASASTGGEILMEEDPLTTTDDGGAALLLQPYVEAVSNSSSLASLRPVILKCLQEMELFAGYDEIKAACNAILEKEDNDGTVTNTLDLFSYGTMSEYYQQNTESSSSKSYLPLTENHLVKLRQLTVLSLIQDACQSRQQKTLSYDAIHQHILLPSSTTKSSSSNSSSSSSTKPATTSAEQYREIEQILSQLLVSKVVIGKLSQKHKCLIIQGIRRPRDVPTHEIQNVLLSQCQTLQTKLAEARQMVSQQIDLQKEKEKQQKQENNDNNNYPIPLDLEAATVTGGGGGPHHHMQRRQKRSRGANTASSSPFGNTFGL